jgi:hypothetical protein
VPIWNDVRCSKKHSFVCQNGGSEIEVDLEIDLEAETTQEPQEQSTLPVEVDVGSGDDDEVTTSVATTDRPVDVVTDKPAEIGDADADRTDEPTQYIVGVRHDYVATPRTWADAKAHCSSTFNGGYLSSVFSVDKIETLYATAVASGVTQFWIGGEAAHNGQPGDLGYNWTNNVIPFSNGAGGPGDLLYDWYMAGQNRFCHTVSVGDSFPSEGIVLPPRNRRNAFTVYAGSRYACYTSCDVCFGTQPCRIRSH